MSDVLTRAITTGAILVSIPILMLASCITVLRIGMIAVAEAWR